MAVRTFTAEQCDAIYDEILAIDISKIKIVTTDRIYLTEFAKAVRKVLSSVGISNRKVGVVVPNYSCASAISVNVPNDYAYDYIYNEKQRMACQHLSRVILTAFPSCDNRSDVYTDYHDARFYVN